MQKYTNHFDQNLIIHYSIPTDPKFCISKVVANYQNIEVKRNKHLTLI